MGHLPPLSKAWQFANGWPTLIRPSMPGSVTSPLAITRSANVLLQQGDHSGALTAYRQSLKIIEQISATDPLNLKWQHDRSVSQEKVGDALRAQGDLAGALATYRNTLLIREQLVAAVSSDVGWQRDLSISHERVGDVLLALGNLSGALAAYQQNLKITERLSAATPLQSRRYIRARQPFWGAGRLSPKPSEFRTAPQPTPPTPLAARPICQPREGRRHAGRARKSCRGPCRISQKFGGKRTDSRIRPF